MSGSGLNIAARARGLRFLCAAGEACRSLRRRGSAFPRGGLAFALAAVLLAPAGQAARVSIRLVDAARATPLEYLLRDEVTVGPDGSLLRWRMPKRVGVDGQEWPFARRTARDVSLQTDGAAEPAELAVFEKELGVRDADEAPVRSDRATDVLTDGSPQALVVGDLADGEHTIHPGGGIFTLKGGEVQTVAGAVRRTGPHSLALDCRPVDLNLVPVRGMPPYLKVTIQEAGQTIFEDSLPIWPNLALRVLLPATSTRYNVTVGEVAAFDLAWQVDGLQVVGTPRLADGLFLDVQGFVVGVAPAARPEGTATAAAAPAAASGLYLFTDRNRTVFAEGEPLHLSARVSGPLAAKPDLRLRLTGPHGTLELAPQALRRTGASSAAVELELDTRLLRPGNYQVQGFCGDLNSNVLSLEIASLLPATNLKLFGYHKWTGTKSYDPALLKPLARHGLNLLVHVADGFGEPPESVPPAVAAAGQPVELLVKPTEREAGAEYLLAHGIETLPVACGLILYFNVGNHWQQHANDRNQSVQHLAQAWRRHPNFRGIVHTTGDGPTPATLGTVWGAAPGAYDIIHGERIAKLREVFQHKVGKLQVDDRAVQAEFERIRAAMAGAIGFGVGMQAGAQVEGEEAVKLEWIRWLNELYPDAFRMERAALAPMIPEPMLQCSRTWGPGAGGGMWEETFWRHLDNPMVDIRGDFGIMPFSYVSGADVVGMGSDQRPWLVLDVLRHRPLANGLKLFLQALSRNPAGIGFYNDDSNLAGNWAAEKGLSEGMDTLMEIGRRFGDLFGGLQRSDEIAVLASLRQDSLAGQSGAAIWGAHFLASKAGYQATVLTEEQCLRDPGVLNRVQALMLVNLTLTPPEALLAQLRAFQQRGGVVIADKTSRVDLPDVVRVTTADMIFANEVNFRAAYARFEPLIEPFRKAVAPRLPAHFTSSTRHVHAVRSRDGELEYWTTFNDTLLSEEEHPGNGHFIQFLYKGVTSALTAKAPGGALYDALRRTPVAAREGGGRLHWDADLRLLPGTIYLWTPRPVAELAVQAPERASLGQTLLLRAEVRDGAGQAFKGRLPVEYVVTDARGAVRERIYRTTNRDVRFKLAGNDPLGEWTWRAVEQATGLSATGTFQVQGPAAPPGLTVREQLVYDAPAIHAALRTRTLDVLLYPEQAALKETAEALVARLQTAGVKARLRVLWPSARRNFPMNWHPHTVEDEEIEAAVLSGETVGRRVAGKNQFGTRRQEVETAFYKQYASSAEWMFSRDVILLSRGDVPENPLVAHITRTCRMLPRNPSPNFPAPGQGLMAYAWAPFQFGCDAIVLHAPDAVGLDQAVASLVALAVAPEPPPAARPSWRARIEDGQTYGAQGLADGEAPRVVVCGRERVPLSLLPPIYPQRVLAASARDGRLSLRLDPRQDTSGPRFAEVDLASGSAVRFRAEGKAAGAGAGQFSRRQGSVLPHALDWALPDGRLMPFANGVASVDAQGAVRWHLDPFAVPNTLTEARYPRRCQRLTLAADGQTALAAFFDLNAGGNYGPNFRQFNPPAVVLLDVASGRELARYPGYLATSVALADDGACAVLVDHETFSNGRTTFNPHGQPVVAAFARDGRELVVVPTDGAAAVSLAGNGALLAVTYADPRREITLVQPHTGSVTNLAYARVDVGVAVAADGNSVCVAYADGCLRRFDPAGRLLHEETLPAPGQPVFLADGTLAFAADDGRVYFPGTDRAPLVFGDAPVQPQPLTAGSLPSHVRPPQKPFWEQLGDLVPVRPLTVPPLPPTLTGGQFKLEVPLPKGGELDVVMVTFDCTWPAPDARLRVQVLIDGRVADYVYDAATTPTTVSVPLRTAQGGTAVLTLAGPAELRLSDARLRHLRLGDLVNAALTAKGRAGANRNVPWLMVPNVVGFLGDPRGIEQVAYGWPGDAKVTLPPDLTAPVRTELARVFDGDVLQGTPLYPASYPGHVTWAPVESRSILRSAQVVMAFEKPRTIAAVGIWEHPFDRPVSAFALEYTDDRRMAEAGQNVRQGLLSTSVTGFAADWKLAVAVGGNRDYYHLHRLAKPVAARYWRYTVLETSSTVQRVAEIELYESGIDALEHLGDATLDAGNGPEL